MKCSILRKLCFVLCSVFFLGSATSSLATDRVFSFGVVPQFEARKLAAIWVPILGVLEKRTGYKFNMEGSARIPEFEAGFQRGAFDFAYMNPYHALVALEKQGYNPLVRDGSRQLFGVLVVKRGGPYKKVEDLNGKMIAFPAPNALGASLLMRAELTREQKLKFETLYSQTHTSSYLNVVLGKAAAAGGVMSSLKKQKKAIQESLDILYETKKMAPHPIVAHPRVPKEVVLRVQEALLAMGKDSETANLMAAIPMKEPVIAGTDDYQALKKWGLQKFYVKAAD